MKDTSRILYVLKYLQEKSDEEHGVTITQILDYLETVGINASRRTIPNDIKELQDYGIDIITVKSTQNQYFIGERHFELPELKLLIDAVLSSKFITPKKSETLINKLTALTSQNYMTEFAQEFYVADRVKPKNESIYLVTDTINTAINLKKQISFKYFEFMPDKSKVKKNNGSVYHLNPYTLVWNEDKYYVFGYSEKYSKVVKFRVDRMCEANITDIDSIPCPSDFNIADFCKEVFQMYDGRNVTVRIRCKNELMNVVIDKFGEDVHTEIIDDAWFCVTTNVFISPMFFGWLFQFTEKMIIISPDDVVAEYHEMLKKATLNL